MIKRILPLLLLPLVLACSSEDPVIYDPVAQLAADILIIDQYVADENLTVDVDPSGLRYIINEEGQGDTPVSGKRVFVHYEVFLLDGTFIDTSIEQTARDNNAFNSQRSYVPFDFVIGSGGIIAGFSLSTLLLKEGGSGTFLVPSAHAYRDIGNGTVPPNASLLFNIELIEIQN